MHDPRWQDVLFFACLMVAIGCAWTLGVIIVRGTYDLW